MRALRWPVVAAVLIAAVVTAASLDRPAAAPDRGLRASSLAVTSTSLVCPNVSGSSRAPSTMTIANVSGVLGRQGTTANVQTVPLTGVRAKASTVTPRPVTRIRFTRTTAPTVVQADGSGAGAVVADQSRLIPHGGLRGLFTAPCLQPTVDTWITGPDGRVGYTDTLVLANPGSTIANLTVTGWSSKGPIQPPKLQSFTINAHSAQLLSVSQYAPDGAFLTLHVHANSGRVAAAVLDRRISGIEPIGLEWIPPTLPPATSLVVPGFLSGPGARQLLLAAPGDRDATVSLRLVTPSGDFAPAGHQTVVVRAGHSAAVDLTASLSSAPGAVLITSDQPVTAAAVSSAAALNSSDHPDIQWQAATEPIASSAVLPDNTPPFNRNLRLYLTAPKAGAKVKVATTTGASRVLTVGAGRTLPWDPVTVLGPAAYGPLVLTPVSGGPVYASRTLYAYGLHGPLVTSEEPIELPAAITLPAAVPDERVAVPGTG